MPRLKGLRHPREIIAYRVGLIIAFALSTADSRNLLASVALSFVKRETNPFWVNVVSARISPTLFVGRVGKCREDQVAISTRFVIPINGQNTGLWRRR